MSVAVAERPAYFKGVGDRVARFAETQIRQTKGRWAGRPLKLEPWQRQVLDELYLVDANGDNVYREALIGLPRKNGKSTLSAALALYGLLASGEPGAEVYAAAASKDQARIVFNQAREFVEGSPELQQWLKPMRNVITCPQTNGVFRVLSSDAPLQHGLNPSMVVIDELHAHKDPELYYALTTGQLARQNPLVVSITTAGHDRESILWQVYEHGRALHAQGIDAMREARFLFWWFTAPDGSDVEDEEAWKIANPSSWITVEDLRTERARLPEFVFRRLHRNEWTETADAWVSPADWDACVGEPLFDPDKPCWIGVDIGLKRDATAFVWVQWHGNDLHIGHMIRVPEAHKPLTAQDNRARLAQLVGKLGSVQEVSFDPWSFRESAEMLADMGLPMVQYDQGNANMAPASERIYELIREHRVVHDGDEVLRRQILAAVVGQTERGWRISKSKSKERIDAAVALTIAADRAVLSRVEKPQKKGAAFF